MRAAFMIFMRKAGFFNSYLPTHTLHTCQHFLCVRILMDYEEKIASLKSWRKYYLWGEYFFPSLLTLFLLSLSFSVPRPLPTCFPLPSFSFSFIFTPATPFLSIHLCFFPSVFIFVIEQRKLPKYLLLLRFYYNKCFAP